MKGGIDYQRDRPPESRASVSILLLRFITRQQCYCGFSQHHYGTVQSSISAMKPSYSALTFENLLIANAIRGETFILLSVIRLT